MTVSDCSAAASETKKIWFMPNNFGLTTSAETASTGACMQWGDPKQQIAIYPVASAGEIPSSS